MAPTPHMKAIHCMIVTPHVNITNRTDRMDHRLPVPVSRAAAVSRRSPMIAEICNSHRIAVRPALYRYRRNSRGRYAHTQHIPNNTIRLHRMRHLACRRTRRRDSRNDLVMHSRIINRRRRTWHAYAGRALTQHAAPASISALSVLGRRTDDCTRSVLRLSTNGTRKTSSD